jgi:hypothetical protein
MHLFVPSKQVGAAVVVAEEAVGRFSSDLAIGCAPAAGTPVSAGGTSATAAAQQSLHLAGLGAAHHRAACHQVRGRRGLDYLWALGLVALHAVALHCHSSMFLEPRTRAASEAV